LDGGDTSMVDMVGSGDLADSHTLAECMDDGRIDRWPCGVQALGGVLLAYLLMTIPHFLDRLDFLIGKKKRGG
jgi:hypothetical protein